MSESVNAKYCVALVRQGQRIPGQEGVQQCEENEQDMA